MLLIICCIDDFFNPIMLFWGYKMKNKKPKFHSQDLMVLITVPLASAFLVWFFGLNFLTATLLFFGLPSVYLARRNPAAAPRCLFFSLTFLFIGLLGDTYAAKDHSWYVPTVFPFRVFGLVPIEDLIWFFLTSYMILSFYELFFDHLKHKTLGRRMPLLFGLITAAAATMLALLLVAGRIGTISYFYFKSCVVLAIIPLATFLYEFPRFVAVFLKMTVYFMSLFFITEIVGLHNGHWSFPSQHYIGKLSLGTHSIPFEEIFFYIIMFSSVTVAYFEMFDDNRLKLKWHRR